jgi:hypothetical protein
MSAASPDPDDVAAPPEALGWTARHGFITDADTLDAAIREGHAVLDVDDGVVRGVDGKASLATVVRLDREMAYLTAEVVSLYERLRDVSEHAVERFASRR